MGVSALGRTKWQQQQPLYRFALAQNEIAKGLIIAQVGGYAMTPTMGPPTISMAIASVSASGLAGGAGWKFSGATTEYVRYDTGQTVTGTSEFTVEAIVIGSSFPSLTNAATFTNVALTNGACSSTPPGVARAIQFFTASAPCDLYWWGASNDYDSNIKPVANERQHIVMTKASGTGAVAIKVYRNGRQVAAGNSNNSSPYTTSGPYFYVGARHASATATITGTILKSAAYSRALTADEVWELYQNPWQVVRPDTARIYSFPTAGGAFTALAGPRFSLAGVRGLAG